MKKRLITVSTLVLATSLMASCSQVTSNKVTFKGNLNSQHLTYIGESTYSFGNDYKMTFSIEYKYELNLDDIHVYINGKENRECWAFTYQTNVKNELVINHYYLDGNIEIEALAKPRSSTQSKYGYFFEDDLPKNYDCAFDDGREMEWIDTLDSKAYPVLEDDTIDVTIKVKEGAKYPYNVLPDNIWFRTNARFAKINEDFFVSYNNSHTICKLHVPHFIVRDHGSIRLNSSVNDFEKMKSTYRTYLLDTVGTSKYDGKTEEEIKQNLETKIINGVDTYYFKDIDYKKDQDRASWPAGGHLSNTLSLMVLSEKEENKPWIRVIALKLLYHWIYSNYRNTNWWQNEIGANQNLTNIAIIAFSDLSEQGRAALRGKIRESSIYHRPSLATHEGSNLINYCDMTIKSGIIDKNQEEIDIAINCAANTVLEGGVESYQKDGHFFQHSKQIQTGSYGLEGTVKLGKILHIIAGTNNMFPDSKLKIISNYINNGLASLSHRGMFNYMALSRAYTRVNALDITKNSVSQLEYYLEQSNMPDSEKIRAYLDSVYNKEPSLEKGVHVYENAKLLALTTNDEKEVYMAFKGTNYDMINTECVNHENFLGYNLSYGQNTAVMDEGDEYYNISPLWDYTRLPGSTSRNFGSGSQFDSHDEIIDDYVKNTIGNGLYEAKLPEINPNDNSKCIYNIGKVKSDDGFEIGISMTQSVHDITTTNKTGGVEFTVTCFASEEGLIVLGAGLENKQQGLEDSEKILTTTLEQCLKGKNSPECISDYKIKNNNVYYHSLDRIKLTLKEEHRQAKSNRNNPSIDEKLTTSGTIITIERPLIDNTYAYAITTKENPNYRVVLNNKDMQVVELPNNILAASFYKGNSFIYEGKTYTATKDLVPGKGHYEIFKKVL